ncbi:hypothetical protein D3C74_410480 [compost metagenome]
MVEHEPVRQADGAGDFLVASDDFGDGGLDDVPGFFDDEVGLAPVLGPEEPVGHPRVDHGHDDRQRRPGLWQLGDVEDGQPVSQDHVL